MTEYFPGNTSPAKCLIVVLHGYQSRKQGRLERLIAAIREDLPSADVIAPELETARLLSMKPAAAIAGDVIDKIDGLWRDHGGYDEVILVGHSTGGALARKVMLGAWGPASRVPFESTGGFDRFRERRDWAVKISRLVMIAGISSGWRTSGRQRWKEWLSLNFFGLFGHLMPIAKPTVFDFRQGAPFIANTRLQMVDHLREQAAGRRPRNMITIQMLGSSDGIVAPNESLDFNSNNALDQQLFILEVPLSDHVSILDVSLNDAKKTANARRRDLLRAALVGEVNGSGNRGSSAPSLLSVARDWHELDDHMPRGADSSVENVVFVIHGIRDDGHWTKKIAARVKDASGNPHTWRSVTPSYGYFAMLPFVLPWIRRQKVEWLMHEYCEAAAQYPNATFHYVGHSNGTYLGAAAMRDYAGCYFKHIAFAGSVVHPTYDWKSRSKDSGVEAVMNYVATRDWVVAMAPNAVRHLRGLFDLGGAGHLGFGPDAPNFVRNLHYIKGGHSAAIAEERWDEIARFIVNRSVPLTDTSQTGPFQSKQALAIQSFAKASPIVAIVLLAFILGIFVEMTAAASGYPGPKWVASVMSPFASIPGVGWITNQFGQLVSQLSDVWHQLSQPIKLVGLVGYAGLLRFIATRF